MRSLQRRDLLIWVCISLWVLVMVSTPIFTHLLGDPILNFVVSSSVVLQATAVGIILARDRLADHPAANHPHRSYRLADRIDRQQNWIAFWDLSLHRNPATTDYGNPIAHPAGMDDDAPPVLGHCYAGGQIPETCNDIASTPGTSRGVSAGIYCLGPVA
jgi:hypothetical protein